MDEGKTQDLATNSAAKKYHAGKRKIAMEKMCEALALTGILGDACKVAGVPRATHFHWLHTYANYARRVQEAYTRAFEMLEREATRRAVVGIEKPVFQGGKQIGVVREYSDKLLMFIMSAQNNRYRQAPARITTESEAIAVNGDGQKLGVKTKTVLEITVGEDGLLALPEPSGNGHGGAE